MSVDLHMLVWSVALTLMQLVIGAVGANRQVGMAVLIGNRDNVPTIVGWAGRAQRSHRNMLESIGLFAILVLTAAVAGRANATTALGAEIFFWSRLAYAVVYIGGVLWVRTLLWAASIVGLAMIFLQLI